MLDRRDFLKALGGLPIAAALGPKGLVLPTEKGLMVPDFKPIEPGGSLLDGTPCIMEFTAEPNTFWHWTAPMSMRALVVHNLVISNDVDHLTGRMVVRLLRVQR